jgi:hypothetical protein
MPLSAGSSPDIVPIGLMASNTTLDPYPTSHQLVGPRVQSCIVQREQHRGTLKGARIRSKATY